MSDQRHVSIFFIVVGVLLLDKPRVLAYFGSNLNSTSNTKTLRGWFRGEVLVF